VVEDHRAPPTGALCRRTPVRHGGIAFGCFAPAPDRARAGHLPLLVRLGALFSWRRRPPRLFRFSLALKARSVARTRLRAYGFPCLFSRLPSFLPLRGCFSLSLKLSSRCLLRSSRVRVSRACGYVSGFAYPCRSFSAVLLRLRLDSWSRCVAGGRRPTGAGGRQTPVEGREAPSL
jgi:hypothetical protein